MHEPLKQCQEVFLISIQWPWVYIQAHKRPIRFLLVLLIMIDTLRRMFCDTRPIDIWMLVIELLVLLIIGAEAGYVAVHAICQRGKLRKIFNLMAEGQSLQKNAPRGAASPEVIEVWRTSVNKWLKDAERQLKEYSTQAVSAFLQETPILPVPYGRVSMEIDGLFDNLNMRLANLRGIMEKPEVYF